MNVLSNLRNFLYANENFIALYNNKIYLYNISKIITLKEDNVIVLFNDKIITINGSNLKTYKYYDKELILSGLIERIFIDDRKSIN